ncbi:hypothetical protein KO507_17540 [Gilvimarinus agarilyticus]|uniref:hypothetical protein n=1 Tax=Gilvimarinus sp. 2_MG-2023 TaxID=3062666 RepID=UPI001C083DD3|nr:hypothetical protein [Gilvimarinus sp. 2_MG-2023]MBU2887572.1 hypothetical protein [Gilvimarinus agarilyticus]MDO6572223.1 hypothetical protein [Gilvimarinus sp. 2_MG-2023]
MKSLSKFFLISLMVGAVSSCASLTKTPEERVTKRAGEFVQYLVAKDLESARQYTTPAYRKSVPVGRFKSKFLGAANWTSGKIKTVDCIEDYCKVVYDIEYYSPVVRESLRTELSYRWIESDGKWWVFIK